MPLRIAAETLQLVQNAKNEILLGIITVDDEVRLVVSSLRICGHREWLQQMPLAARRGFSLVVKDGLVYRMSPLSALNPDPYALLESDLIEQVLRLLPLDAGYQVDTP